ncbi:Trafficking kinesin-binding protein 1 [Liparis tanakae]|uniref:Trafficking kinesin-binding protein 1 n=1 Tax=Liparis tanakae TaxID=230148 RepID=A0A4Z2I0C6_9TELE|nr:Trafficking kinesin-binding protein 1 [Liparis tanakae]
MAHGAALGCVVNKPALGGFTHAKQELTELNQSEPDVLEACAASLRHLGGPQTPSSGLAFTLNPPAPAKLSHPASSPSSSPPPAPLPPPSWSPQAHLATHSAFSLHEGWREALGGLAVDPQPLHLDSPEDQRGLGTRCRHASTLTDLCSDLPELEIVSLLSEGQPSYTLRADSVFGYDNDDWLHTPLLPPEVVLGLTLLCSDRVGQVTKTYHDIKAVTHLLEEKERDLELAALIGQSLLKQNQEVTERNEMLDEQLEAAKEEIAQLRHELSMRDDLLQFYAGAEEMENAAAQSPIKKNESCSSLSSLVHYDFMQQKLKGLEDDNRKLRIEACELTTETANYEEQEQELMMVCVEELTSVNKRVGDLSEELARKGEDCLRQQEEISSLLAQIVDLHARCKGISHENEDLNQQLSASRESQLRLHSELKDLQDKYSQCEDMLREAREDIKNLRNKSLPNGTWQQLAKPNLGGILHPRPGVLTKDFRQLEVDFQHVYSLNDLEEDEPDLSQLSAAHGMVSPPGPNLPLTSPIHTITTCHALQPSLLIPSLSASLRSFGLPPRGSRELVSASPPGTPTTTTTSTTTTTNTTTDSVASPPLLIHTTTTSSTTTSSTGLNLHPPH